MRRTGTLAVLGAAAVIGMGGASEALAGVVLNETFTGATKTAGVGTDVYTIAGVTSWYSYSPATSSVNVESVVGNPAESIKLVDTDSASGRLELNFGVFGATPFNTTTPGQEVFKASADIRVDSYVGSGTSNFRVVLKDGGRTNPYFAMGLSHGVLNGTDRLFLYAGDTASSANNFFTPGAADAIGWNTSTNTMASGFDFGSYNSSDAASNDTNDEFYRLTVEFRPSLTPGLQDLLVTATQLSSGLTASLSKTTATPYVFSNTSSDYVTVNAPGSGTGTMYVDNITLTSSAVPEPASMGLIALGALGLLGRRRRR